MPNTKDQTMEALSAKGSQQAAAEEEWPRFSWPHMYLGAIGMAISLYAFLLHAKVAPDTGFCRLSEHINCDKVLGSQYGALFGIPLGAYGMAYFIVVLLTAVTTNRKITLKQEATQRLAFSSLGLVAVAVLAFISYVVIKAACPVCMATHATLLALFGVSLWQFLKVRKAS